ncbi:hypothetical protein FS749_001507 [Ceratobasidium sp. UAMH 11750]|nr:hypothetical protein FS749_001507 [Ceratobasidium sp. UAMH 11750]
MYPVNIKYDQLPSSYEKWLGEKRGGHVTRTVKDKQQTVLTPMERLHTCEAKL